MTVVEQIRSIAPSAWAYLRHCAEDDDRIWGLAEDVRAGANIAEAARRMPRSDGGVGVTGSMGRMYLARVLLRIEALGARSGWGPEGDSPSELRAADWNTRPIRKFVRSEQLLESELRHLRAERDQLSRRLFEVRSQLWQLERQRERL